MGDSEAVNCVIKAKCANFLVPGSKDCGVFEGCVCVYETSLSCKKTKLKCTAK